jgi:hypothetical protein
MGAVDVHDSPFGAQHDCAPMRMRSMGA